VTRSARIRAIAITSTVALLAGLVAAPVVAAPQRQGSPSSDGAVFFVSDGLRQDLVAKYAARGVMPTMREFLRNGTSASGGGLLTQAPPNTGAGWYTLATGAWPGVHGSTNNTFHINGQPFGNRTTAFDPNVLQVESIAQSAERGGLKVAQVEWAGGRNATIQGPTIDFQSFFSGRGVATNFIGHAGDALFDDAPFITSFGLQFDTPAGYAGQAPFPGAAPAPAIDWTGVPRSYSPAREMRLRVLDGGVDKYGLNAYIFDSTNDHKTNYDRVLFSPTKNAADAVGTLKKGQWADVKVKIQGGPLDARTAGMLVRVEELTADLSRVRLFHTSVTRALASWPTWGGEPGFSGDFAEYLGQKFPTATAADFAILEAGITSEQTYVDQGLYWATGHLPMLRYVARTYKPDLLMVGMPTTDEFQHQFLGLVSPTLPSGDANPAYDDVDLNGVADGRVAVREGFIRAAYQESDETLTLARSLVGKDPVTFVASDHGFAPQFLAIDASQPLVDMGLLSNAQTSNCRPATGEKIGKAKACWAGGTVQIYLNVGTGPTQIPAAQVAATVDAIKAKYLGLTDPNDWTHDGQPEGWKMIDRVYSKAEARYIPNGPGSTTDMAHPTRTGDVVVFSYPPYQFDAETPGTLVAFSHFFGQHGYVPDVQDLKNNINMRATFLAGGSGIAKGQVTARSIDLAPTLAYLLGIPEPQYSQGKVLLAAIKGSSSVKPISIVGLNDFHGQLDQTTTTIDGQTVTVGGASQLATMFDEDLAGLPGPGLLLAGGDNVGASPPNSGLLEDKPTIDVENAWGLDATSYGNHEFDFGVTRLLAHQANAHFPFLAVNIIDTKTGKRPSWVTPSVVFTVNGVKVGVIGAELESTPELVSAGATAGLTFLPEEGRIRAESERLRKLGVKVQVLLIHEGSIFGANPSGNTAGTAWEGPIVGLVNNLQNTTLDAVVAGHTHRVSNLMVGHILVTEGINAGVTYSVLQLMVKDGDVAWAGGATRLAKNIGIAKRADVAAIVTAANTAVGPILNQVVGKQKFDIRRDGERRHESAMGNMVADALREGYPADGVEGAWTNSGGLRVDLPCDPPSASEGSCVITRGELFADLPFGNATAILTLTGAQVKAALLNGFSAFCNPAINTGRFPQLAGLKVQFHCTGTTDVLDGVWKAPDGPSGTLTPLGDADTFRFVTNDFMLTGGDGYTVFTQGSNVKFTGDLMLDVVSDYVADNQPVGPVVEGRIVGP
jgi:2',3'-cyclic-nucleotide 2'-phosphodiesterase (5'-nucleotidase family)